MNTYMGMRVAEWEDGQVNIGIAVKPSNKGAPPVIGCYWTRSDMQLSNKGEYILPTSAFIMRPATTNGKRSGVDGGNGGLNINYAVNKENGTSSLGLLLTSNSSLSEDHGREGEGSELSGKEDEMKGEKETDLAIHVDKCEQELEEVKRKLEGDGNLTSPQESESSKSSGSQSRATVKRVSWLEDIEKFSEEQKKAEDKKARKEKKGRRGTGAGKSNQSGKDEKKKNSGDKSRIPVIEQQNQQSCEYYRRMMLREYENSYTPPSLADNWYGYTSLQRYAGEKVMKKFAQEQKRLEEDMSNRRKTEIWILGSELDDFVLTSPSVPVRKKVTRLKPIQIQ